MKKLLPGNFYHQALMVLILLCCIAGCKKDLKTATQILPNSGGVLKAKSWYLQTYNDSTKALRKRIKVSSTSNLKDFDLVQALSPDWDNAFTFQRGNQLVTEMGIKEPDKFLAKLTGFNKVVSAKENSKSDVLIINKNGFYNAYVMTIMADSGYAAASPDWRTKNNYRDKDKKFSGAVSYFSLSGYFMDCFVYENGVAIKHYKHGDAPANLSAKTQALKSNSYKCVDLVLDFYDVNDMLIASFYVGTSCSGDIADYDDTFGGIVEDENDPDANNPAVDHSLRDRNRLPINGSNKQVLNTCVFATVSSIIQYFHGNVSLTVVLDWFYSAKGIFGGDQYMAIVNGISSNDAELILNHYFTNISTTSISHAIDRNRPLFGYYLTGVRLSDDSLEGHAVMITGYNNPGNGGQIQYFDPETGLYNTAPATSFQGLYEIQSLNP